MALLGAKGVTGRTGGAETLALGREGLELALPGEPAKGGPLELAPARGGQPHALGHRAQRQRIAPADAEAQLDHLTRVRVEPFERAADRLLLELDRHLQMREETQRRKRLG